ncbi:hypothetical protein [Aeromonas hydrophila]|uniref:hypothetical protein n=1 Tax=Aeromonas hydrophila TaxID=644 RepID=UPI0035B85904
MKLVMQLSELNGFSPFLQSGNRRLTRDRGVMEDERRVWLMSRQAGSAVRRAVRGRATDKGDERQGPAWA